MIKKISDKDLLWIRKRVNTQVMADIEEFLQSGDSACEISIQGYKNATTAYNSYRQSAKRGGYAVSLTVREGRLFMFREES